MHTILVHTGIIYWQVIGEKLDEAEQQIEFLTEIQSSIGKNTVSNKYSNRIPKVITSIILICSVQFS